MLFKLFFDRGYDFNEIIDIAELKDRRTDNHPYYGKDSDACMEYLNLKDALKQISYQKELPKIKQEKNLAQRLDQLDYLFTKIDLLRKYGDRFQTCN